MVLLPAPLSPTFIGPNGVAGVEEPDDGESVTPPGVEYPDPIPPKLETPPGVPPIILPSFYFSFYPHKA
jgi:hypothetical protein